MKKFVLLWILAIVGSLSVLPYVGYLEMAPALTVNRVLLITLQSAVVFALICFLSYKIVPKTDLRPFSNQKPIYPALISGAVMGVVIFILDKTIFHSSLLSEVHPPIWAGALASIYGAVNEELLLRLFLFTTVYYLLKKWFKFPENQRIYFLWSVNILVALIFGLGHLPAAFKLVSPSAFDIFRILFLNGIAGILFGWLYWSRGLWAAMGAHFVSDLVIHTIT